MKRKAGQDRSITASWRPATLAVRGGTARSEWGETSEALFLTSGYTYDKAADAANAMKITAQDLLSLKVIDRIIAEPVGGAHRAKDIPFTEDYLG